MTARKMNAAVLPLPGYGNHSWGQCRFETASPHHLLCAPLAPVWAGRISSREDANNQGTKTNNTNSQGNQTADNQGHETQTKQQHTSSPILPKTLPHWMLWHSLHFLRRHRNTSPKIGHQISQPTQKSQLSHRHYNPRGYS
jgi:hypothetical protein